MVKGFAVLICFLFGPAMAVAQQWSVYAGAAADYDGFFRDAAVTSLKSKWPFMIGGAIIAVGGYRARNGFDVFADASVGFVNVKLPLPEDEQSDVWLSQVASRVMLGSGPHILVGEAGNSFTPFIQLGAAYLHNFESSKSIVGDNYIIEQPAVADQSNWAILFGAGIDYQFSAKLPSSINLNVAYSPLNVFKQPYAYTVTTNKSSYDLNLQGKLLQVMLSYRIYLNLGKRAE